MTERSLFRLYKRLSEERTAHTATQNRLADVLRQRDLVQDRLYAIQLLVESEVVTDEELRTRIEMVLSPPKPKTDEATP